MRLGCRGAPLVDKLMVEAGCPAPGPAPSSSSCPPLSVYEHRADTRPLYYTQRLQGGLLTSPRHPRLILSAAFPVLTLHSSDTFPTAATSHLL